MNTLSTYGRLCSDVTTNDVNGRTVAKFRFASNNKRKQPDGSYGTNFYNVSAWGALSEIAAKYLKKGHRATISGDLVIRKYKGNDGLEHDAIDLDANSIDLVETKAEAESKSGAAATQSAPAAAPEQGFTQVETDELPF